MSTKGTKTKIVLNLFLLIGIFAIIYYLINQSFDEIFAEILSTSWMVFGHLAILHSIESYHLVQEH